MKKFLALCFVVLLFLVGPAFAVGVSAAPVPVLQEVEAVPQRVTCQVPALFGKFSLTTTAAYAESDSDSREFNPPGEVEEEPIGEASTGGTLLGVAILLGFLYWIDKRAKKKGKPGLVDRLKNVVERIVEIFHKRE